MTTPPDTQEPNRQGADAPADPGQVPTLEQIQERSGVDPTQNHGAGLDGDGESAADRESGILEGNS